MADLRVLGNVLDGGGNIISGFIAIDANVATTKGMPIDKDVFEKVTNDYVQNPPAPQNQKFAFIFTKELLSLLLSFQNSPGLMFIKCLRDVSGTTIESMAAVPYEYDQVHNTYMPLNWNNASQFIAGEFVHGITIEEARVSGIITELPATGDKKLNLDTLFTTPNAFI